MVCCAPHIISVDYYHSKAKLSLRQSTMASLRFFYTVEMSLPCLLCPCPSSPISLSSPSPRYHLLNTTFKRLGSSRTLRITCSSSSTFTGGQTQQSSFNDAEMKLIDALIGIQGRGKSASPKQLNVCVKNFFACFLSYVWFETVLSVLGCGICCESS